MYIVLIGLSGSFPCPSAKEKTPLMQNKTTSIGIVFLGIMRSPLRTTPRPTLRLCDFAGNKIPPPKPQSNLSSNLETKSSRKLYLPRPPKPKQAAKLIAHRWDASAKE